MEKLGAYRKLLEYMKKNPQPKSQRELAGALGISKGAVGYNLGGKDRSEKNKTYKALSDIGLVKKTPKGYAWYTYRPLREHVDEVLQDYFNLSEEERVETGDSLVSMVNEGSSLWVPKIKDSYKKVGNEPPEYYSITSVIIDWLKEHVNFGEEEWEKIPVLKFPEEEMKEYKKESGGKDAGGSTYYPQGEIPAHEIIRKFLIKGIHITPKALKILSNEPESSLEKVISILEKMEDRPTIVTDEIVSQILEKV